MLQLGDDGVAADGLSLNLMMTMIKKCQDYDDVNDVKFQCNIMIAWLLFINLKEDPVFFYDNNNTDDKHNDVQRIFKGTHNT